MGRTRLIAIIILAVSIKAVSVYAQRGAAQPPASPELLFNMTAQNETRLPPGQDSITTPNMDIHLYGDGKNIIVAVVRARIFPGPSLDCAKSRVVLPCATGITTSTSEEGRNQVHHDRFRFSSRASYYQVG